MRIQESFIIFYSGIKIPQYSFPRKHPRTTPCGAVVPCGSQSCAEPSCLALLRSPAQRHCALKCAPPCCAGLLHSTPASPPPAWHLYCSRGDGSIRGNYKLAVFPWQQDTVSVRQNQTQASGWDLKKDLQCFFPPSPSACPLMCLSILVAYFTLHTSTHTCQFVTEETCCL